MSVGPCIKWVVIGVIWAGGGGESWGGLQPQGRAQNRGRWGLWRVFFGDERLLPADGRKVLRNRETETEGETNRGWEG